MTSFKINLNTRPTEQNVYGEFDSFFAKTIEKVNSFRMTHKQRNELYEILESLVVQSNRLNKKLSENSSTQHTVQKGEMYICTTIKKHNTIYKRNKTYIENQNYVEPEEVAIGIKWKSNCKPNLEVAQYSLKQTTYQYVPIVKTLKSLFSSDDFKNMYFGSNHKCVPEVFERFCCANVFQDSPFYRANPDAIQLRLYMDEFEVCCPVKTKNVIHKICGIYFQVLNMPQHYLSKLKNIYLVALCESQNLHHGNSTLDNILSKIVSEIKSIEEIGIDIGEKNYLKGTLACFSYDNAGGNTICGFTECFSQGHFCRQCNCSKAETENLVEEKDSAMRSQEQYEEQLRIIANSENVDLEKTQGVKKRCILNNLSNFNILANKSVDLMHDSNEGVIPRFLGRLFEYCTQKKILTKSKLQDKIRDFNYGVLNAQNLPSFIDLKKGNLGQNATQLYRIMLHVPFILYEYKEELKDVWICIQSLIQAMQIMYSRKITKNDVCNLKNILREHFSNVIKHFKAKLTPKEHILTHYPGTIEDIGPVINVWTMRDEAKHKIFTTWGRQTNNFVNLTKTLAVKHQQQVCDSGFTYSNDIQLSKNKEIGWEIANKISLDSLGDCELFENDFFYYNSYEYRQGLFIVHNNHFFHIDHILSDGQKIFWFVCVPFKVIKFNDFCNSFEIEKSSEQENVFEIIKFSDLENKASYEKKYLQGQYHIIADTLDLRKEIIS